MQEYVVTVSSRYCVDAESAEQAIAKMQTIMRTGRGPDHWEITTISTQGKDNQRIVIQHLAIEQEYLRSTSRNEGEQDGV